MNEEKINFSLLDEHWLLIEPLPDQIQPLNRNVCEVEQSIGVSLKELISNRVEDDEIQKEIG
ncbi:TPA: hypothetical protein I8Y83_002745 [Legionella pneumophila]|uniref:Uncharacterized protein n=1 Tax=Legionella bozemanae TaxID=447 RepID=A0A0W0RF12_LEGBO|nr:hypothetical protein [Legionella bozemanae]KTC69580.1 hypothetical protein Lboz_3096 [Legionella bozemanae]STP13858.1 Uncharacterised protein [Legionella bozemanae]HAT1722194.1 hypothetical protein [Legionella pneumophila]